MLISFSGLDGAGKTTQIELLKTHLDKKGIRNEIIWSRGGYTKGMKFLKRCLRSLSGRSIPEQGKSDKREQQFSKSYIRKTWLVLSIIDLVILYCIIFRIKSLFGLTIIADRYLEDTAIDFTLNFHSENVERWSIWRFLIYFCPKPHKHFVALIPVEESMERSIQKNEPFPDSQEVLCFRRKRYKKLVEDNSNVIEIDGMESIIDIHSFILKEIEF